MAPPFPTPRGRGAVDNPANRFERLRVESEEPGVESVGTLYLRDTSRSVLARNDSPDVGFNVSINPYRGCECGCSYCYARPTHEYLGFSAGLDFESRIMVKDRAPELLRDELASPSWEPQPIALSGVTDPYQPVERKLRLTRGCLEVLAEARNPVMVTTKRALVTRDADLLAALAHYRAASVMVSVTTLDAELARRMEPRASHPRDRLRAIRQLAASGVPVGVSVAPVVPGLTDHEIPAILAAASAAGASFAAWVLLRLPGAVAGLFEQWLEAHYPERKAKVLARLRALRGGRLYDPRFGVRGRGEGVFAEQIKALFTAGLRRAGIPQRRPELSTAAFQRPERDGQLGLFP